MSENMHTLILDTNSADSLLAAAVGSSRSNDSSSCHKNEEGRVGKEIE